MNICHKVMIILATFVVSGCASLSTTSPQLFNAADLVGNIPPGHGQAIVVLADGERPYQAKILAWEREGGWWSKKFMTMPAVIGRNGFAEPGGKTEGDGRTPSGVFSVKRAFGYGAQLETGLEYRQVTDRDVWIDDPTSPQYNQWVRGVPQSGSYEILRRTDGLYEAAAVIEYNTAPVIADRGSAIFLHVWRDKATATAGCVATSAKNIKKILKWLDWNKNPIIILGNETK